MRRLHAAVRVATLDPDGVFAAVSRAVPKHIDPQVREEVIQDLALAVLSGEVALSAIASECSRFVKDTQKNYPTRWGPLSLDQPLGNGDDQRPLKDFI